MMLRNKLLLPNKRKRDRLLLSPRARRLSSRMRRVATKVVTRRASRRSMTVLRLPVLLVESAVEAEAVAVVAAVMESAAVVAKAAKVAVAVVVVTAVMASAAVAAKVAAEAVAVVTEKAVAVVAVKVAAVAVAVVVPELPRLQAKARLRLKELSVADSANVSKERLVRKLILSIDRMEPAELDAASAKAVVEEAEIDLAETMPLPLVRSRSSRMLPLPPKRRPRRLLALSLRSLRKKLASLLMTTSFSSRPNPRVCLLKLMEESTRRSLIKFKEEVATRSVFLAVTPT